MQGKGIVVQSRSRTMFNATFQQPIVKVSSKIVPTQTRVGSCLPNK
jgi:hypothetical protein